MYNTWQVLTLYMRKMHNGVSNLHVLNDEWCLKASWLWLSIVTAQGEELQASYPDYVEVAPPPPINTSGLVRKPSRDRAQGTLEAQGLSVVDRFDCTNLLGKFSFQRL